MDRTSGKRVIIWAIDPFVRSKQMLRSVAQALRTLSRDQPTVIAPVYVFNAEPLLMPSDLPQDIIEKSMAYASTEIQKALADLSLDNVLTEKIISIPFSGLTSQIEGLLKYATEIRADMIALSTHGRHGFKRWMVGSFTETLMLTSSLPLLVVNSRSQVQSEMTRVLFPTDFSQKSRLAFEHFISSPRAALCEITILHAIPYLAGPELRKAIAGDLVYEKAFSEIVREKKTEAKRWASLATQAGFKSSYIVDFKSSGSIAEVIVKYANKYPCFIVMAAECGPMSAKLLGSTARQVVRGASSPVIIMRSPPSGLTKEDWWECLSKKDIEATLFEHHAGARDIL